MGETALLKTRRHENPSHCAKIGKRHIAPVKRDGRKYTYCVAHTLKQQLLGGRSRHEVAVNGIWCINHTRSTCTETVAVHVERVRESEMFDEHVQILCCAVTAAGTGKQTGIEAE